MLSFLRSLAFLGSLFALLSLAVLLRICCCAIVLVALYLAAILLGMSGAITELGKMEDWFAEILQVEKVEGKKF